MKEKAQPKLSSSAAYERVPLECGPLTLFFESGDLRYVKLGQHEVIRRIYAAVRDQDWGTIPVELSNLQINKAVDCFQISYISTHRTGKIHFVWRAEITGNSSGEIIFKFEGEARTTFLRNRIGLCVLHPNTCAGARCRLTRIDGSRQKLTLPILVEAAQPVPGIFDLTKFAHEIAPELDVWAELEFTGDQFEMEDQRNWIDASFKTYCTPLSLPYPVEIKAGDQIKQKIRLKLTSGWNEVEIGRTTNAPVSINFDTTRRPLTKLGLSMASHGTPLTAMEASLLDRLRLTHLRADLKLGDDKWLQRLDSAHKEASDLELPLELAVHLPRTNGANELCELARNLRTRRVPLERLLLFRDGEKSTSAASLAMARPYFAFLEVPIGVGTDADFYQLNQFRPPYATADFVHWPMNPQVHAFDNASIAETPMAVAAQIASARAYFPGKPLVISPVTFKPRFNPVADGPESVSPDTELPAQVDPRQLAPFAAIWAFAMIKHLAESGVESITLFETTGWRGVIERETGSPLPQKFPSIPGQVFPVYYTIAATNLFGYQEAVTTHSSSPMRVESFALTKEGSTCLWLANPTSERQQAMITGVSSVLRRHNIDWLNEKQWKFDSEHFLRDRGQELSPTLQPSAIFDLSPYELVRLEVKL